MRTGSVVAAALGLALALGACSAPQQGGTAPSFGGGGAAVAGPGDRAVDTPELRDLKAAAGIAPCPRSARRPTTVGDGLPDVSLACLGGGRPVDLAALRGRATVLNLWASWCGPCKQELPYLAQLSDEAGGKVRVVGIDVRDGDPAGALRLARSSGVTYPLLADPAGRSAAGLKVVGLPHTVFVGADGTIAGVERRPFTSYADLADSVRQHLGIGL